MDWVCGPDDDPCNMPEEVENIPYEEYLPKDYIERLRFKVSCKASIAECFKPECAFKTRRDEQGNLVPVLTTGGPFPLYPAQIEDMLLDDGPDAWSSRAYHQTTKAKNKKKRRRKKKYGGQ